MTPPFESTFDGQRLRIMIDCDQFALRQMRDALHETTDGKASSLGVVITLQAKLAARIDHALKGV